MFVSESLKWGGERKESKENERKWMKGGMGRKVAPQKVEQEGRSPRQVWLVKRTGGEPVHTYLFLKALPTGSLPFVVYLYGDVQYKLYFWKLPNLWLINSWEIAELLWLFSNMK
jgi:hypothetical protein